MCTVFDAVLPSVLSHRSKTQPTLIQFGGIGRADEIFAHE
jgi:hypothetical protein